MGDLIDGPNGPARFCTPAEESRFRSHIHETIFNPQPLPEANNSAFWQAITALTNILGNIALLLVSLAAHTPTELVYTGFGITGLIWLVCLLGIVGFNYPRGKRQHILSCLIYMALPAILLLGLFVVPDIAWLRALALLIAVLSLSAFPLIFYTKHYMYHERSYL